MGFEASKDGVARSRGATERTTSITPKMALVMHAGDKTEAAKEITTGHLSCEKLV